jgi:hypothetical protein
VVQRVFLKQSTYLAIIGSLVLVVVLSVFLDPLPVAMDALNTARVRRQLPLAMERWQSHSLSNYRIHVKGSVPLTCFVDGVLTVRDSRLVAAQMRENPLVPDSPLFPVDQADWDRQGCSYEDLTVERMFERVKRELSGAGVFGVPLTVRFDEETGFITEYRFGRSSRSGVFGYGLSECCTWFEFDSFVASAP